MATPQTPQKTPIAAAVQAALPLPAVPEPEGKNDVVLLAPTPELNPRNKILKDIAARSNADADSAASETIQMLDDEGNEVAPPAQVPPTEPEEPETVAEPTPDSQPLAPTAAAAEPLPAFDPNAEIDVIVDGKPMKVKGSQIIERGKMAIQKETAADYKLELATRLLKDAEARAAAIPAAPAQPAQPAADAVTDAQLAQAIQFGTQDQATAAIAELTKRGNGSQQSAQQLMQAMPAIVQQQLSFQEGVSFVKSEYADLLADPYLQPLFIVKEQQMRQAGDKRSFKDLYKAIGDDIRTHFNRPKATSAAPAPAATTREQKVAAKAAAPAAPKLASARMEAAAEQKPLSREEVFEKMRRARGQAQMPQRLSQQ